MVVNYVLPFGQTIVFCLYMICCNFLRCFSVSFSHNIFLQLFSMKRAKDQCEGMPVVNAAVYCMVYRGV